MKMYQYALYNSKDELVQQGDSYHLQKIYDLWKSMPNSNLHITVLEPRHWAFFRPHHNTEDFTIDKMEKAINRICIPKE